jgi:hypothetical protein
MLRASNSLHYGEGHKVFSAVTGGRPSFFSRRISGGSRSPEPVEGNAQGARFIRLWRTPPLRRRRKNQAGSLGTEEKAA